MAKNPFAPKKSNVLKAPKQTGIKSPKMPAMPKPGRHSH